MGFGDEKLAVDNPLSTTGTPKLEGLPVPVLQSALADPARRGALHAKRARIDGGIKVHWSRFIKRMGTGTAPSTSSTFDSARRPEDSQGGSSVAATRRQQPKVHMENEKDEIDEVCLSAPLCPVAHFSKVVVDREWAQELKTSVLSQSERDPRQEQPGSSQQQGSQQPGTGTDMESLAQTSRAKGFWGFPVTIYLMLRWRIWPHITEFFSLKFFNAESERHYAKEYWFMRKVGISIVVMFHITHPRAVARDLVVVILDVELGVDRRIPAPPACAP